MGLRLFGVVNLGTAELWSGELEAAARHLEEGLGLAETMTATAGEEFAQLNCLSQLALVEVARGRLRRAVERGQAAVAFAERRGWSQAMQAFGGHLALAWARYQQDDLSAADRHLERADHAARERTTMVAAALVRSWLLASKGHPDQGLTALRAAVGAVQDPTGWQLPAVLSHLALTSEARLLAAIGDTGAARALLARTDELESPTAQVAVVLARLQQADGDLAGAAATLAGCLHGDQAERIHPFLALESLVLDAVVQAELGADEHATRSLEQALRLAAPDGFRRVFIDGGTPVHRLLVRQLERGTEYATLVAGLLRAFGSWNGEMQVAPSGMLVEPLTERERTVLHYLPSALTIAEIASELYVSVNTVKSHCKSIYRKLGASGRRDAVAIARRLRLL